jgi:hypothetical protein
MDNHQPADLLDAVGMVFGGPAAGPSPGGVLLP